MIPGTLYGVGVGPGAPDLMTLRAVRLLQRADVIAIPRRSEQDVSLAWRIAEENVGPVAGQERLPLTFPMTRDPARLRAAWEAAFDAIATRLERGRTVAFVTEGDPLVYSTFIHLLREAPRRFPAARIEIVPAVTSLTAVPAAAGIPLADGDDRIAILPATYGVDDLAAVLRTFDTVVLMKVGSVMADVVAALEAEGLVERAVYVSRASTAGEQVVRDVRTLREHRCDYFSMVVVARRGASGGGRRVA